MAVGMAEGSACHTEELSDLQLQFVSDTLESLKSEIPPVLFNVI
jgi:hypothetical protein